MTDINPYGSDQLGHRARTALAVMARHKVKVPEHWQRAEALYAESIKMRHSQPPLFPGMGKDVGKYGDVIAEHARALAEHRDLLIAAQDASEYAQRSLNLELDRQLPVWMDTLIGRFDKAATTFASIGITSIYGHSSDADVTAYRKKMAAVDELHWCTAERVQLGDAALNEVGIEHSLWLIVAPPAQRIAQQTLARWADLERSFTDATKQMSPFDKYQHLLGQGATLSLAGPGQVNGRRDTFAAVRQHAAEQARQTPGSGQQRGGVRVG